MPVVRCEARHGRDSAPERQTDDQEDLAVAVVGQKPGEEPRQDVGVVEDRPGHHLVEDAPPIVPPAAGVVGLIAVAVLVLSGVHTGRLVAVARFQG